MFNVRFDDLTVNELKMMYESLKSFKEKIDSWHSYFEKNEKEYMSKDWSEKEGINRIMYFDYQSKKTGVEFIQEDFIKCFHKCL